MKKPFTHEQKITIVYGILCIAFVLTAAMAVFLACPMMITFTIGALGMAAAIGLGNGAVFKLVPEYFPQSVGAVTGMVGAAGGLGGFFPPRSGRRRARSHWALRIWRSSPSSAS